MFRNRAGDLPGTAEYGIQFNLQVWHYLSIFAALSLFYVWQILPQMGAHIGRWFAPLKRTVFIITTFSIFFLTLPFAVIAPALVTLSHGSYRDAHGIVPSLDGFAWLRQDHYSDYAAIQWLNRFVEEHTKYCGNVHAGWRIQQ